MAAGKMQCLGTKLIDKITTHVVDGLVEVEKLEDFWVGTACSKRMVNIGQFFTSLIRQNVVDENDIQLLAGLLKIDEKKWIEKAIRMACSKKAIESLVSALQSSGNEWILEETYEWLAKASEDSKSHTFPTDLDTSQAVGTNNVILRNIFEYLDSTLLCNLARVNKVWKQENTILLRKRADLNFELEYHGICSSDYQKTEIHDAMQLFEPLEIAPVHAMSLDISSLGPACPTPVVLTMLEQNLVKLSLKYLRVALSGNWFDHEECPPFKLARGLLKDENGSLATLQLKITSGREVFLQLLQHSSFPSLKVLILEEDADDTRDEAYTNYVRALVSLAPNLQRLDFYGDVNLEENFLGERQQEVLVYPHLAFAPFIADNMMGSLRLNILSLKSCSYVDDHGFQRFMRTLPLVLGTCCRTTLKQLIVDPMIALALMSQGIVLESLEVLCLSINYGILERLEPRILENFRKFDFMRIFPKLTNVVASPMTEDFQPLPEHMEQLIEAVANINARPDRAANNKTLQLFNGLSDLTLDFYFELFPHTQKLFVLDKPNWPHEAPFSFASIWKMNGINLKDLIIVAKQEMFAEEDFDSAFCGIFPEEVAELREKTEDYLKSVNIVPVKPSFTRLKNLCTLTLEYPNDVDAGLVCSLSKVTGLIAFAKLPALKVTLRTKRPAVYEALQHMKPYALVKLVEP